jgi:hypothetical protein
MKNLLRTIIVVVMLAIPTHSFATACYEMPCDPVYVPYRAILVVGPEYTPMPSVPYTLLINGVEYIIDIDNPNVLPFIWGLREGAYELTALAYLAVESGHFPDILVEFDVAHVMQLIIE